MLTYAAIKFTCEPRNIYVIRAREHLHFGKKFFVGKLMCNARWKCKQNCHGIKQHLDEDDCRPAEVLLMGNSRKTIVAMLQQHRSNISVIESTVTKLERAINNKEQEKKRKRDEINQSMSPTNCKRFKSEQEHDEELDRTISQTDGLFAVAPSKLLVQINKVPSYDAQNISFKDHNENAIMADTRTATENINGVIKLTP